MRRRSFSGSGFISAGSFIGAREHGALRWRTLTELDKACVLFFQVSASSRIFDGADNFRFGRHAARQEKVGGIKP
jgi:hypothetical protein